MVPPVTGPADRDAAPPEPGHDPPKQGVPGKKQEGVIPTERSESQRGAVIPTELSESQRGAVIPTEQSESRNLAVPQAARAAALDALLHVEQGRRFLRGELHAVFDRMKIDPRDRALALQLAAGAIRHRRTLRLLLSHLRGGAGRASPRHSRATPRRSRAGAIQPQLLAILELGAFQLLFLDRVPAYAAINEAVGQACRAAAGPRGKKTAGFVNGMLRGLQRLIAGREPQGDPARDALPHPEGGVVRLREPVLPDPKDTAAAFLGAAYSYPDWLVARWLAEHGDRAAEICRWSNRRPRIFARANPMHPLGLEILRGEMGLRGGSPHPPPRPEDPPRDVAQPPSAVQILSNLHARGRACHSAGATGGLSASASGEEHWLQASSATPVPGPRPGSFDCSSLPPDRLESLLAEGALTVQDPSSMAAVEALAPRGGEAVLDLCASPGTKTTQIVEAMGDRGTVVACDRSEEKLAPIRRTVAARRLASVTVCLAEDAARFAPGATGVVGAPGTLPASAAAEGRLCAPPGATACLQAVRHDMGATGGLPASARAAHGFDAALVDAPCSNTGVLARRPEARWRLRPEDLEELPRMQLELLAQAAALVRPGGRMVYSTCSLQREENDGVVRAFLAAHPAWRLVRSELIFPAFDHDGAFWAMLAR